MLSWLLTKATVPTKAALEAKKSYVEAQKLVKLNDDPTVRNS